MPQKGLVNKYKAQIFKGTDGNWFGRIVHKNGREILRTSEGYRRVIDCIKAITNLESPFIALPVEKIDAPYKRQHKPKK